MQRSVRVGGYELPTWFTRFNVLMVVRVPSAAFQSNWKAGWGVRSFHNTSVNAYCSTTSSTWLCSVYVISCNGALLQGTPVQLYSESSKIIPASVHSSHSCLNEDLQYSGVYYR
jgi:hypothetical protein